jgi:hypothetical protein
MQNKTLFFSCNTHKRTHSFDQGKNCIFCKNIFLVFHSEKHKKHRLIPIRGEWAENVGDKKGEAKTAGEFFPILSNSDFSSSVPICIMPAQKGWKNVECEAGFGPCFFMLWGGGPGNRLCAYLLAYIFNYRSPNYQRCTMMHFIGILILLQFFLSGPVE